MLFGFAAALIAGFALTAVENWTHAKSVSPGALAALTVLWVTARLSGLLPTPGGQLFAAAVDCLFLPAVALLMARVLIRSEEHTSELQSLMRTSYAVFCLKKKYIICMKLHLSGPRE